MASFVYTDAKRAFMSGEIDLHTTGADVRVALVMTNTSGDTEQDVLNIADITTLDEFDGANYVRKTLTTESVVSDDPNNRGEFLADNITWTALGAGTRAIAGMVVYKHVTNDTDAVLLAYIDTGGFPFTPNGGDLTITWNAQGILQLT